MRRTPLLVLGIAATLIAAGTVRAEIINYTAQLSGASEVPPTTSTGKGSAVATLNTATKSLDYNVEYTGLTGPAAAGHIHGPAAAGANAGVLIPFANPASPIKGTATLTDEQMKALQSGQTYVNIHTAANKPGEIRGQLTPAK
jgi:hypothetical protein